MKKQYSEVKCTKGGTINGHTFAVDEIYPMLGWNNGNHLVYENGEGDVEELILLNLNFTLQDANEIVEFIGYKKRENKTLIITLIILLCLFMILLGHLFSNITIDSTNTKFSKYECAESGVCVEGLEYTINHDKFIVSKETCLNHNKKWNDELKVCYMY